MIRCFEKWGEVSSGLNVLGWNVLKPFDCIGQLFDETTSLRDLNKMCHGPKSGLSLNWVAQLDTPPRLPQPMLNAGCHQRLLAFNLSIAMSFNLTWPLFTRTETPWHLTDGRGNSTEPTGGHVWSIRGHRCEKLFRIPSMVIGGPLVENPWPPVDSDNLVCGTFRCRKNGKKTTCNFAGKFSTTYSGKAITQSSVKLHHFWRYGCRIRFKQHRRLNRRNYFGVKGFSKSRFEEISHERHIAIFKKSVWENDLNPKLSESRTKFCDAPFCLRLDLCHLVAKFIKARVVHPKRILVLRKWKIFT